MNSFVLKSANIPKKLYTVGEKQYFKKDDIIIHSGDIIDCFYILVKGSILCISYTIYGSFIYNFLLVPPSIFAEIQVINKKEMNPTFKCLENIEVIKINRNALFDLFNSDPEIQTYIQNNIFLKMEIMAQQKLKHATLSAEDKIAFLLVEFAEELGKEVNGTIKINYHISQEFIGNFAGVQRITTYRFFEKLKENDTLEFLDGYYYIKNMDLLKKYASHRKI